VTDRLERRELDRREEDHNRSHESSKWANPSLWVSVCGLLLTITLATFGFIASKLSTIDASIQSTRDEVQSTRTAVVAVTTRQERDNGALEARIENLENAINVQQNAFNFNFTTRLATAEAKVGIRTP
jgi:BMFP domain-containing protein YqiC